MKQEEVNQVISNRYKKWSKILLRVGLISLVISFIIIAINTENPTLTFISSIGLVVAVSSLVESYFLSFLCKYMLKKK